VRQKGSNFLRHSFFPIHPQNIRRTERRAWIVRILIPFLCQCCTRASICLWPRLVATSSLYPSFAKSLKLVLRHSDLDVTVACDATRPFSRTYACLPRISLRLDINFVLAFILAIFDSLIFCEVHDINSWKLLPIKKFIYWAKTYLRKLNWTKVLLNFHSLRLTATVHSTQTENRAWVEKPSTKVDERSSKK